ncbi:FAD:protein FMN transferase [Histomonas meleagridis]|uniref:FAD:protein FMN transferase n=1 Tax=Histomonas meleagridis TaxID=135588 RepID=UPI003559E234|nr:FAD:protein FMN transferase [Histomonas meleagridis]KAH0799044.1 FAD:protein FMN transferase [Histomonas meleagridis]
MEDEDRVYSYTTVLMGSPILLKLFVHDESVAQEVFNLIKHFEDIFTVNRDKSEVMDINHAAGMYPVSVSQPVYELIKCAKAYSMIPGSALNLTIGPLVKLWKIGFNGKSVPPPNEIRDLLPLTRPDQVVLNDSSRSVFLSNFGMEIDLGGIAKGYIADCVRDFLKKKKSIHSGLINLGGNVYAMSSPLGDWGIGLKKPFAKTADEVVGVIQVSNKSVVTSGVYERYFEQDGKMYHHILNPATGYPLDNELLSVTIISNDSLDGDIWTTIIYGMGVKKGVKELSKRNDIEAIFITRNNEIIYCSSNMFRFSLKDESYKVINENVEQYVNEKY